MLENSLVTWWPVVTSIATSTRPTSTKIMLYSTKP